MENQEDTARSRSGGTGHRLLDLLFFFVLFAGLMLAAWSLLEARLEDLLLAVVLIAGVVTHTVSSFHHHRKARDTWDELATLTPLQTATGSARPPDPLRRIFRLDHLVGRYDGRPVTVEAEHLPFWRGGFSFYSWLIGRAPFETHLTVPVALAEDLEIRLEKRKLGEKTYTRLGDPGEHPRTRFEREHHLFTDDKETARRLLEGPIQAAVERLGEYDILRIQDGQVRLTFPAIPGRLRMERGLDTIVQLADRVEALRADRD